MIDQTLACLAFRNRALSVVAARTTAFARASTATYTDVNGIVQTAAVNVLRNAHYVAGVGPQLLYEPNAATNICLRSEEFDNAAWTKATGGAGSLPVVTANSAVAPDGSNNADKVVFSAPSNGDSSLLNQNPTVVISTGYVFGFYVQAFAAGDIGKQIIFRHVGGASYTIVTLTAIWQFVSSPATSFNTLGNISIGLRPVVGGGSSGTVTVNIWGTQLELGSTASSYIPTAGTAATRAADIDQMFAATATGYTRQAGSFLTEGFADGMEFVPAGFSDVTPKVIESVSAGAIVTTTAPTVQTAVAGRSLSVGFPETRAFDNRRAKPIAGRPYIEEDFVPGGHSLMGTTSGYNNEDGLYLIKYYGLEGKGIAGIRKWVDALKALFSPGTNLVAGSNTVRVRTDVSVKSGQIIPQGNGWAVCTVTVPWWALSNNAVAA